MSIVYFTRDISENGILKLIKESSILDFISKDDVVAIKIHVGEDGNKYFLNPKFVKVIVDEVSKIANPILTDTSTYYKKKRHVANDHIKLAKEHGFDFIPFIPSDIKGGFDVETDGILKTVEIASLYKEVDKLLVITHCTGHILTSYAGAIKNIAMGMATKNGKLIQHRTASLKIDLKKCNGCENCTRFCQFGSPIIKDGKRIGEKDNCMRCPDCELLCPQKAVKLEKLSNLSKALASTCYGFLKFFGKENIRYLNFALNITNRCDCASVSEIFSDDIGIFASNDIVSIDTACLEKMNLDLEKLWSINGLVGDNPFSQIIEAEKLGLGSRIYELKEV